MLKSRTETLGALVVLAIGLVAAAVLGLWAYMSTTPPLYPKPQDVPSVTDSAPLPKWGDAVEQGRQIVRAALTEHSLPGLSVAVGTGGDLVWAEGFGWADLDNRVRVSPETRFRIGTASVALTSAAVGLLLERGQLKLDEKIQTYVPESPEQHWPVTLRQLMGHVAGVANDGGDEGPLFAEHCERPVDAFQYLSGYERERLFEPGTQYHYSSYGWILVSAAVEAARHGRHDGRVGDRVDPGSRDVLLPEVRSGSPLRLGSDSPAGLFLLRGILRIPVHSVRPRALRDGDQQRHTAATRHGHVAPDVPATGLGRRDGLRSWLGPRDRHGGG
jgi:Beta-lactamase